MGGGPASDEFFSVCMKMNFLFSVSFFFLLWIKPRASNMLGKYCVAENSSSLFKALFLFMCMSVFLACMCIVVYSVPRDQKRVPDPRNWSYRSCKVPDTGAGN